MNPLDRERMRQSAVAGQAQGLTNLGVRTTDSARIELQEAKVSVPTVGEVLARQIQLQTDQLEKLLYLQRYMTPQIASMPARDFPPISHY